MAPAFADPVLLMATQAWILAALRHEWAKRAVNTVICARGGAVQRDGRSIERSAV